ncbi:UNVERIFIED_CONTAM: Retrovirus-related Pol polyprotein from transposon TNT 1-94 [Sesamum radiatum]|uniref:Retrovirus-related Pol polyprotein from transposon TNT 1-94 n=1 Tax=Sesamum radiatum TaxID=300843 RepID=A0AAW2MD43_SESRA
MHFLLTTLKVVYMLSTLIPEYVDDQTVEQTRRRSKWENDDYIYRGYILNGMSDTLFDIYHNVESAKALLDALEAKYMAEDASSKKFLGSNFNNYKMIDSRSFMEQYNELLRILGQLSQHNLMMDEVISVSSVIDRLPLSWKDFKHTLKHQKEELSLVQLGSNLHIEESLRAQENDKPKGKDVVDSSSMNMVEDHRATKTNDKKGKRKVHDNKHDGSNKKSKLTCWKCGKSGHLKRDCCVGKGRNYFKNTNRASGLGEGSKDHNPNKGHNCNYNLNYVQHYVSLISEAFYVQDDDVAWWIDSGATTHACKDRGWFKVFQPVDDGSILHMGNESSAPIVCFVGIIHETTAPYTPQQNGVSEKKNRILKEMVNSMLSYSGLSDGFWGEAMLTACYLINRVPNKRNNVTPYELWFYVVEHNDFISVSTMIESREAIFDETRFSSIPRPKEMIPSTSRTHKETESSEMTPNEPVELRKNKRKRKSKSFRPDFQLYLIEGSRDEVSTIYPYCFNVEDDSKTFDEVMKSQDVSFWKETINDETDSIMGNNTWLLADLPPGCKPLGCKWIFKRKMKADGTIKKFKARLFIQGFR